jgi:DNA recombination-dependent growth factor C
VGLSAQEVQRVLPESVVPAPIDEKYLTLRYEKVIPLIIEAIKEQQTLIEDVKLALMNRGYSR